MLSTIDLVELEVLRITSAPPAAARLFPSRTISSAPRSRIIFHFPGATHSGYDCGLHICFLGGGSMRQLEKATHRFLRSLLLCACLHEIVRGVHTAVRSTARNVSSVTATK